MTAISLLGGGLTGTLVDAPVDATAGRPADIVVTVLDHPNGGAGHLATSSLTYRFLFRHDGHLYYVLHPRDRETSAPRGRPVVVDVVERGARSTAP